MARNRDGFRGGLDAVKRWYVSQNQLQEEAAIARGGGGHSCLSGVPMWVGFSQHLVGN